MQEQQPKEVVQPFGITLIAALTAIIPLVVLLRGEAKSLSVLAAIFGVTAGVGLFFQRAWGRWLTIVYYAAAVVLLLVQGAPLLFSVLSCILPVSILVYLFLPGVVACFTTKKN
ncbi:hypothetical protein [Armatimonas sp.]|uniref:hypothetical protein n=1 Tax=Armatimonas sp. TaxID=1872638 RepID=UPI003752F96E